MFNYLLAVVLLCSPAWATWTLTQVKDNTGCAGTTCAVTVTSTGSGHLLVAGIADASTGITISSVTAAACSSSWTHAANTAASQAGDGSSDLFYCLNSASGQTSITITVSATSNFVAIIWEAASTLGNIAVDSGATPSGSRLQTSNSTGPAGTSLSLSSNNKFIAAIAVCGGTCSGLTGTGFTNDLADPSGDGVAHGIISTSGAVTAPATWTQSPSSTMAMNAAAFQESSGGGGGKTCTLALMGAGPC